MVQAEALAAYPHPNAVEAFAPALPLSAAAPVSRDGNLYRGRVAMSGSHARVERGNPRGRPRSTRAWLRPDEDISNRPCHIPPVGGTPTDIPSQTWPIRVACSMLHDLWRCGIIHFNAAAFLAVELI